jgi:D-3-phosphoglycerate dehydrogenase
MRLSRWGQSPYETNADIAAEATALSALVQVLPPGGDAEIVVVHSKIPFGEAELVQAPSCRLVITTTSGTDHLDLPALEARGVTAARLPLARRDAVVETALMMMLWGLRATGPLQAAAQAGRWARGDLPQMNMRLLGGRTVGLLGLGVIGSRVATVLRALGADVLGCDPRGLPDGVRAVSLPALLSCDVLSLHCDLNPTSAGIIGAAELSEARPGMVLVNTARGGLVDEEAALQALAEGRLGAVCLDVFAEEPWPGLSRVDSHPALMVLPHAAGFHTGLPAAIQAGLMDAVTAHCQGAPVRFRVS